MIRNFEVGNETLKFEFTNETIFKIDEKYNNFGLVINGLMYGTNLYNNALKVMESSCISKRKKKDKSGNYVEYDLTLEELKEKLTPAQIVNELIPFTQALYLEDYRGIKSNDNKSNEKENKKK